MGGEGQPVQADETYFRVRKPRTKARVLKGDQGDNKPTIGLVSGGKPACSASSPRTSRRLSKF